MDAQDKENLMTLFDDFSYVCSSVFWNSVAMSLLPRHIAKMNAKV